MKKVEILSSCFIPSDIEGQMKTAYTGSVLDLDDDVAGNLVAAQRAKYAEKGAKLVDTTKRHEDEAAARAQTLDNPQASLVATIIAAVQAANAKPAA